MPVLLSLSQLPTTDFIPQTPSVLRFPAESHDLPADCKAVGCSLPSSHAAFLLSVLWKQVHRFQQHRRPNKFPLDCSFAAPLTLPGCSRCLECTNEPQLLLTRERERELVSLTNQIREMYSIQASNKVSILGVTPTSSFLGAATGVGMCSKPQPLTLEYPPGAPPFLLLSSATPSLKRTAFL